MSVSKNIIIIVALVAVSTGVYYIYSGNKPSAAATAPEAQPVSYQLVGKKDIRVELELVGTASAYQTVSVKSRIDSQITKVTFKDGDYVNKDDLLFLLDDRTINAQISQDAANLERDKAQLENLYQQYKRTDALVEKGYQTQGALDTAKAAYESQKAIVESTRAALDNTKVQLEYTKIRSPISGRTGTINVTVGNNVKANDAVLVSINMVKPIRVQMSLPQKYFNRVHQSSIKKEELTVSAFIENKKEPVEGKIEYIDNGIDMATGTFIAKAAFPNKDEKLWPGMFVNLKLVLGVENDAVVIPEFTVQKGQEGDYVYLAQGGKVVKKNVKISRIQDDEAIIESGLEGGENLITDSFITLKDGDAVKLKEIAPVASQEKNNAPDVDLPGTTDKKTDTGSKK